MNISFGKINILLATQSVDKSRLSFWLTGDHKKLAPAFFAKDRFDLSLDHRMELLSISGDIKLQDNQLQRVSFPLKSTLIIPLLSKITETKEPKLEMVIQGFKSYVGRFNSF